LVQQKDFYNNSYTQSGQKRQAKLEKLEKMTAQLRLAERTAGVKSSRLLRKLLKFSTETKNLSKADIVDLSKLYRCVNKDTGSVLWICDDADAKKRARELGFLVPVLQAVNSDVSDADVEGEGGVGEQAGAGDQAAKSASIEHSTSDESNPAKSEALDVRAEDPQRHHSALDESVANLDHDVSSFVARKKVQSKPVQSLQGSTSPTCILL
jgi:hypothetical protein